MNVKTTMLNAFARLDPAVSAYKGWQEATKEIVGKVPSEKNARKL